MCTKIFHTITAFAVLGSNTALVTRDISQKQKTSMTIFSGVFGLGLDSDLKDLVSTGYRKYVLKST